MKKIAFISSLNDASQQGGAYLRNRAIVYWYQQQGFEVTIFYMEQWHVATTLKGLLANWWFQQNVRVLFTTANIDVCGFDFVHFDNLRFFNWNIKRDSKSKLIYNAHNLEFESYYKRHEQGTRGFRRFKNYEVTTISQADLILVCSEREKELLVQEGLDSHVVMVVPNLVDSREYYSVEPKDTILFLGTLDYYPNQQAIEFLINDFFPNLDSDIWAQFRFVIAGRNPFLGLAEKLSKFNVCLQTNLTQKEIYALLSRTYLSLVPLQHGSGTRLKIVESLFANSYVLSTPLGAEGFVSYAGLVVCELDRFLPEFHRLVQQKREFVLDDEFRQQYDLLSWCTHNPFPIK